MTARNTSDRRSDVNAEAFDETVTTDDGDGEGLRSAYPPDTPLGVEDPSIRSDGSIAPDDVATRAWRRGEDPSAEADR